MNKEVINSGIVRAFELGISSFCYFDGAKGDSIDNMIVNAISRHCPSIEVIELSAWRKLQIQKQYKPIKDKIQSMARMRGCDCLDLDFDYYYDSPLLIRQPNDTQQWPDILIIYRKRGINIEVKSSRQDHIVWNSGLPRKNSIYIYNGGLKQGNNASPKTTFFLGQHIINDMEQEILYKASDENHKISKEYNDKLMESGWSLYARPMFNYVGKFLSHENRVKREKEVKEFINNFQWE